GRSAGVKAVRWAESAYPAAALALTVTPSEIAAGVVPARTWPKLSAARSRLIESEPCTSASTCAVCEPPDGGGPPAHAFAADGGLRGVGVAALKSAPLSFASVPPPPRSARPRLPSATPAGAPTRTTTAPLQLPALAPHESAVASFTSAT